MVLAQAGRNIPTPLIQPTALSHLITSWSAPSRPKDYGFLLPLFKVCHCQVDVPDAQAKQEKLEALGLEQNC